MYISTSVKVLIVQVPVLVLLLLITTVVLVVKLLSLCTVVLYKTGPVPVQVLYKCNLLPNKDSEHLLLSAVHAGSVNIPKRNNGSNL